MTWFFYIPSIFFALLAVLFAAAAWELDEMFEPDQEPAIASLGFVLLFAGISWAVWPG